ncbi:MAG TPA: hypothetical protein VMU34_00085 [Mycobacterium sp.]|nr:hypothetical protein [Mycobacterium sp.]
MTRSAPAQLAPPRRLILVVSLSSARQLIACTPGSHDNRPTSPSSNASGWPSTSMSTRSSYTLAAIWSTSESRVRPATPAHGHLRQRQGPQVCARSCGSSLRATSTSTV